MARRQSVPSCFPYKLSQSAAQCLCRSRSTTSATFRLALRTSLPLLAFGAVRQLFSERETWILAASAAPSVTSPGDSEKCANSPPFPYEEFGAQSDSSAVYTRAAVFTPSSIFRSVGLVRFITVFGIPIVATGRIGDAALSHVSSLFADFLDNDRDGKVDNEEVLRSMKSYLVILGYLTDSEESSDIWKNRADRPAAKAFKEQFECRFRFFELWRSDTNPKWHIAKRKYMDSLSKIDSDTPRRKRCTEFRAETYDWPLWYFPFTIAYYGYLDKLNEHQRQNLDAAVDNAKSLGKFHSQYSDDVEMEKADFFAWTILTKLGATECHCDSSDVGATWKICTFEELKSVAPDWVETLENLPGVPKYLHDQMYASPAVVGGGDEVLS